MPEKPKHNPTPIPAPGSAPVRADGISRGHGKARTPDNAQAPAPGSHSGAASASGNSSTPGIGSGQGSAESNATAPGGASAAGNTTSTRDQSHKTKPGKANQANTQNAKPRSALAPGGAPASGNIRSGNADRASETSNNAHNTGTDADALRFVDTADVLSQFTQIEGRFTQVKQGLAHLQRLATLGTLTATLIHEFNNILTPITSYAQLALLKPDDTALARKTHEKTLDAANRATKLCAALLGYAREEDEHTPARAQLDEVVHASLACLGNGLASRGIDVVLELTDAQAAISPAGLEQVLVNLILNARKAMLDAGGTLTIRTRCDQSSVRIEVADTGPGVPAHIADRLFEPFVTAPPGGGGKQESRKFGKQEIRKGDQGSGLGDQEESDGSLSDKPAEGGNPSGGGGHSGGTGLGLSVCRDLVRRAGGDIGFESRPGEGTTFHITLPKAEPVRRAG